MSTPFDQTPKWFDAEFYLGSKLAQLIVAEPEANWTRVAVKAAFDASGFQNPYDHYVSFGDTEGLNPNQYFNATEYLAAKTALLGSTYTPEMVAQAIHNSGMTIAQHYAAFGYGEGLNPSSSFNNHKYFEAKAEELNRADATATWTPETVKAAIDSLGITPLDHYFMFGKAEGLDKYDFSENGQPIPKPGKLDIKLTEGVDVVSPTSENADFKATDRDDVISGSVVTTAKKSTLGATDSIDGGLGVDTLKIDLQADFKGFSGDGGVKNVENIDLGSITANRTFNAKGIEGADLYRMNLGGNTMNITNVDDATTAYSVQGGANSALNVKVLDTALVSREDDITVGVTNVGDASGSFALNVSGSSAAAKVEGLTVQSSGKSNFVNVTSNHENITVEGAAAINIAVATGATSFDASTASGKVNANLANSSTTLTSITGGLGDDTLTISSIKTGAVLDGGTGNDTLRFDGHATGMNLKGGITGFETFAFKEAAGSGTANSAVATTIDLAGIPTLDTIKYEAASAGNDTFTVTGASQGEFSFLVSDTIGTGDSTGGFTFASAGTLNVEMFSATGGSNSSYENITANNITSLNIINSSARGFTINDVIAKSASTLNLNTDKGAIIIANAGTQVANDFGSLQEINVTGNADVTFTAATTENKLVSIDASALKGMLTADLSAITHTAPIEITVGSRGSDITSSIGVDSVTFGAGLDTFKFIAGSNNGRDLIGEFGSNDILKVSALRASGSGLKTDVEAATFTSKESIAHGTATVIDNGRTEVTISGTKHSIETFDDIDLVDVTSYLGACYAASSGNANELTFIINDSANGMAYVYYANTGADTAIDTGEVKLIGTISTDGHILTTANIDVA